MINIALYKPDIPQNTAAIVRLSACLNLRIDIIEPCGFNLDDSRFKRVAMDYVKLSEITRYSDFENFKNKNNKSRIILLKKNDFLLFGRESAGVPEEVHTSSYESLKVPLSKEARSLNVAMTVAVVASEALRQNNFFK